jgi:hypothetical protein
MSNRHLLRVICLFVVVLAVGVVATPEPAHADAERFFAQTGFKIRNAAFLDFFDKRGGARTFGYPTSREFSLLGARVQFFRAGSCSSGPTKR